MDTVSVVGAAIVQGTKVLAAQRSASMNSPYKWEFAGGKVERQESHEEALEREISEELGIKIKVKDLLAVGKSQVNKKNILLYVYASELVEGIPFAREHSQIQWIEIKDLMELEWAEADVPACLELMRLYVEAH